MEAYDKLIYDINTDLNSKGFDKNMVSDYCDSSLKKYLQSFKLADQIAKMEIESEAFKMKKKSN